MKTIFHLFCSICLFFAGASQLEASVKLASAFTDNMVLQRERGVAVWGTAGENEEVTVEFRGEKAAARAKNGRWQVQIQSGKAGGPFELLVRGRNEIRLANILVGEVWLAGGQSNMSYPVHAQQRFPEYWRAAQSTAAKASAQIRFLTPTKRGADQPLDDILGEWIVVGTNNVGACSAVAWYFASCLHEKLGVPVGILAPSVGATPAEAWIARDDFLATGAGPRIWQRHLDNLAGVTPAKVEKYHADLRAWDAANSTPALKQQNRKTRPLPPYTATDNRVPSRFYNGMVHGLEPFTAAGIIWFQADGNAGHYEEYPELITALIKSWRAHFHAELPFYYVEMNNMWTRQQRPAEFERNLSLIREMQEAALKLPRTGVAAAIDLCEAEDDPHFPNKQPVGERLARLALSEVYGQSLGEVNSPALDGFAVEGSRIRLRFKHAAGLRVSGGGDLKGFAIRGATGEWTWAEGKIDGNEIVLWNRQVPQPAAARYAWAANPTISVENGAGLPLRPFRTDRESAR